MQAPGSRLPATHRVRRERSSCRPTLLAAALLVAFSASVVAQQSNARAEWNLPQKPFKVFGNTYWVGTRGLGAVLITSDGGHILIDGALPESVPQIRDHVRELGFKLEDIRLLLNTHVHYDHAGGLGQLQQLTGARAAASAPAAKVLESGASGSDDPQFGLLEPIDRLKNVEVVRGGQVLKVGSLEVTAHDTPGHTPGGTSWSWRSCEGARCLEVVYADSLNPVSADGFKYTSSPLLKLFDTSYATLEGLQCDILLAPHPAFTRVFEKLAAREKGNADAFVEPGACKAYVAAARENLKRRVAQEQAAR